MMIKVVFAAALVALAVADNTDVVISGFSEALGKLDIPADRKAKYQVS